MFTKRETEVLTQLTSERFANLDAIAKMLVIRGFGADIISTVIDHHTPLKHSLFPNGIARSLQLVIDDELAIVDELFGKFSERSRIELDKNQVPTELRNLYRATERFLRTFSAQLNEESENERVDFEESKLSWDDVLEQTSHPYWTFEEFAAFSLGKRISGSIKLLMRDRNATAVWMLNERIALMRKANELPETDPGHLAIKASPRRLIEWAVSGKRFEIAELLLRYADQPSYDQLKKELEESHVQISQLQAALTEKRSSGPAQENNSLKKLVAMLASCIRRTPMSSDQPLFQYDREGTFVSDLIDWSGTIIDDTPLDKGSILKFLRISYEQLSPKSKKAWKNKL